MSRDQRTRLCISLRQDLFHHARRFDAGECRRIFHVHILVFIRHKLPLTGLRCSRLQHIRDANRDLAINVSGFRAVLRHVFHVDDEAVIRRSLEAELVSGLQVGDLA